MTTLVEVRLEENEPIENALKRFKKVVIPELNLGQLQMLVRARYLVDAQGIHKIKGKPFRVSELVSALEGYLS